MGTTSTLSLATTGCSTTTSLSDEYMDETSTLYSGLSTTTTSLGAYNNEIPHVNITVAETKQVIESMTDEQLASLDALLNNKEQELLLSKNEDIKVYEKKNQL